LRIKLKYLDGWTAARQRNAARYRQMFSAVGLTDAGGRTTDDGRPTIVPGPSYIVMPYDAGYGRHIYNQFIIRTDRREAVMAKLKARQIGHEIYYPVPLHLQECFADLGYKLGDMPASESAARETLALPIYGELTEAQQQLVAETIAAAYDATA
jgi:dTDP-4-amino-4,6-dideoxygalactose transaminase